MDSDFVAHFFCPFERNGPLAHCESYMSTTFCKNFKQRKRKKGENIGETFRFSSSTSKTGDVQYILCSFMEDRNSRTSSHAEKAYDAETSNPFSQNQRLIS